uniref:Uncharacterized protein n=1 Tax=Anguilla anguilla TaxID=7936 RepID=A0A0E9VVY9_ANGAN
MSVQCHSPILLGKCGSFRRQLVRFCPCFVIRFCSLFTVCPVPQRSS